MSSHKTPSLKLKFQQAATPRINTGVICLFSFSTRS